MILGFKHQFVPKIKEGTKIHSIREDKHCRWRAGRTIQFATGVRTPDYNQFHEDVCKRVDRVWIDPEDKDVCIGCFDVWLPIQDVDEFAKNDGFDTTEEFWEWFDEDFYGVIIHWTDKRYI